MADAAEGRRAGEELSVQDKRDGQGIWGRMVCWAKESAWAPLCLKGAGYGAAALLLFAVGSGAFAKVLSGGAALPTVASAAVSASFSSSVSAASAPPGHEALPVVDGGAPDADAKGAQETGVTADGKVVLNLATEEDLKRLPGVGPAKAKAILALRAKLGKFKKVDDLLRVKGIGRKKLSRLRPLLLVDPPSP